MQQKHEFWHHNGLGPKHLPSSKKKGMISWYQRHTYLLVLDVATVATPLTLKCLLLKSRCSRREVCGAVHVSICLRKIHPLINCQGEGVPIFESKNVTFWKINKKKFEFTTFCFIPVPLKWFCFGAAAMSPWKKFPASARVSAPRHENGSGPWPTWICDTEIPLKKKLIVSTHPKLVLKNEIVTQQHRPLKKERSNSPAVQGRPALRANIEQATISVWSKRYNHKVQCQCRISVKHTRLFFNLEELSNPLSKAQQDNLVLVCQNEWYLLTCVFSMVFCRERLTACIS